MTTHATCVALKVAGLVTALVWFRVQIVIPYNTDESSISASVLLSILQTLRGTMAHFGLVNHILTKKYPIWTLVEQSKKVRIIQEINMYHHVLVIVKTIPGIERNSRAKSKFVN